MAKKKRTDGNSFIPPIPQMAVDIEGPSSENMLDTSNIYDQVVYEDVHPQMDEWEVVEESEAMPYFPSRIQPVNVKLGIERESKVEVPLFSFIKLEDHFKYKKGYILNTGGNIWGLDFVPKVASQQSDPLTQYLAVGGYRGAAEEHMSMDEVQPTGTYKNCIQIYKLKLSAKQAQTDPVLEICILHDFGVIYDLKWCPYGAYEESANSELPKLGILTIACGDETIRTMVVPHPEVIRTKLNITNNKTIYLRVKASRCTLASKYSKALAIAWGGHKKLASCGTAGDVTVWNMESALRNPSAVCSQHLLYASMVLDAPGKNICWRGIIDPYHIIVGGFDGQIRLVDMNDPSVPFTMSRSRGPVYSIAWPGHAPMLLLSGAEDVIRALSYSASMGPCYTRYGEMPGPCWSIGMSEHHGHLSVANATGWIVTTNVYQPKLKSIALSLYVVYKLCYHAETKSFIYVDGLGVKTGEYMKKVPRYELFGTPEVSLQKVTWNPNKETAGFIASGGAAGLCRIEFEGRGPNWE
ncbi:hypothetical protein G6F46_004108 [Rhizopus delemar]|uniref:Uncharacterized protein n=2 Tax=Rhizopus TaxID=4842 RepID=A0A9P6Z8B3_9FUNG|nr:hypothetical protein G6F55_003649 [Rhizopus delemar]KAG1547529.1 hypothetical protein G6F51_004214 [Rhizopus arrhizus]KAG1499024.1 hypothetical protein G6F54_004674 [Rhizopus delemar]KAG1514087.1 hypothetical protein G6F53_003947 [Rhizopus delemar]KAG1522727.1 hypothetical protein G6F52_005614 [Rhizopus delemar]